MKQLEKEIAGHSQKMALSPVLEWEGSNMSDLGSFSGSEQAEAKQDDNWKIIQEVIAEARKAKIELSNRAAV